MRLSYFIVLAFLLVLMGSCGLSRNKDKKAKRYYNTYVKNPERHKNNAVAITHDDTSIDDDNKDEAIVFAVPSNATGAYIQRYAGIAMQQMKKYRIPASITMAQGILESNSGRSKLSRRANNHFGIKCHKNWNGARAYHDDDSLQECFRKYDDPADSYRDHSLFLTYRERYAFLFDAPIADYRFWAKGLRKAGYATDTKYPQKLLTIIERYQLYYLDSSVISGVYKKVAIKQRRGKNNRNYQGKIHTVKKGDTLYNISKRYGVSVAAIKKINDLDGNELRIGQQLKIN